VFFIKNTEGTVFQSIYLKGNPRNTKVEVLKKGSLKSSSFLNSKNSLGIFKLTKGKIEVGDPPWYKEAPETK